MNLTMCSCPVWKDLDGTVRTDCLGACVESGGPGVYDAEQNRRKRHRIREALEDDGA